MYQKQIKISIKSKKKQKKIQPSPLRVLRMIALPMGKNTFRILIIILANWLLLHTTGLILLIFYYLAFYLNPYCYMESALTSRFCTGAFNLLHFIDKSGSYPSFLLLPQWKPFEWFSSSSQCISESMTEHSFSR